MADKDTPPPPSVGDPLINPDLDQTFWEEVAATAGKSADELNWGAVSGQVPVTPVGHPSERFDLLPDEPLRQLAILMGAREDDPTKNAIDLYNHAMSSMREAWATSGANRRHNLIEAARACLLLADQ